MRFGLQARFIAILLLTGLIAVAALFAVRSQLRAHDRAIAESVRAYIHDDDAQRQSEALAKIRAVNHRYHIELMLTLALLGLILASIALLISRGLVQPIDRLAGAVRRIEDGDDIAPLRDTERNDEIGDLTRAFGTIHHALVAMRQRMDHDADQPAPMQVSTTMVFSPPVAGKATDAIKPALSPHAAVVKAEVAIKHDLARESRLEDDLREAWQRGEMRVLYQPIHSLADGSMRGAEALLRWQHPADGAIAPDEFIPLAERSELIEALGRNVLIQACSDAGLWPSGGTPDTTPFLSVNVSARQLHGPQLFEAVVEALRRSGLAASRLHLEMPVAVLRSDDSTIAATIEQLRGLGVRIWLDAVGADAVDQARWMKLSVDGVKVGRSRIAGKTDDPEDMASTGAIVATARALRVVAVVVGVEGLAQLNVLREQGADLAQGFVLCKPVGTAEIGRRLLA